MITRCRFCGQKIRANAESCEHCGKSLVKIDRTTSSVDLESWKDKSVPAWVMYLTLGLAIAFLALMFSRGCEAVSEEVSHRCGSVLDDCRRF